MMENASILRLVDAFDTFQGEGLYAGTRALFVRMPYCDLKCSWCDTEFNKFTVWSEEDFLKKASSEARRFAVITGGEPMMNKQTPRVVELLKGLGFFIACETNGHFPIVQGIDFATCSPKRDGKVPYFVHPDAFGVISEFKYVVDEGFDFTILDRHDVGDGRRYSLSPEFGRFTQSMKEIMAYIVDHPGWRYSLQTHKILSIP